MRSTAVLLSLIVVTAVDSQLVLYPEFWPETGLVLTTAAVAATGLADGSVAAGLRMRPEFVENPMNQSMDLADTAAGAVLVAVVGAGLAAEWPVSVPGPVQPVKPCTWRLLHLPVVGL